MRLQSYIASLLFITVLAGCAGSRPVSSGRPSTGYGAYSEDLSSARPRYGSSGAIRPTVSRPTSASSVSASSAPTSPVSTRRTDNRRPTTGTAPGMSVNRQLDTVLDSIAIQNRSIRYAPGFRIQIYVGTQRQEVDAAKLLIAQNFPELNPYLSYNQPTYKLKVGDFMRRIDAERYYASIRQLVRSALLQDDKVDVRRALLIK